MRRGPAGTPLEEPVGRPARHAAAPPAPENGVRRHAAAPVREDIPPRRPVPPVEEPYLGAPRRAPDPRQSPEGPPVGGRRRLVEPPEQRYRRPDEPPAGRPARTDHPNGYTANGRANGRPNGYRNGHALARDLGTQRLGTEHPGTEHLGAEREPARDPLREPRRDPGRRRAPDGRRASADEPTTARPATRRAAADRPPPGPGQSGEPPGRHRRRAGESPNERPAAAYRELLAAEGKKPRPGRRRRTSFWKELPLLIVVALVLTFLIQTFIAKVYVIPSGSMETTLHGCPGCNNDRVLVDKVTYRFSDPQPGDVVVFRGPDSWSSEVEVSPPSNAFVAGLQQLGSLIGLAPPDEKDFVKRVIAVGGQTVQCCTPTGQVMVDGKPLVEPYIYYLPGAGEPRQEQFGPVTVPEGELWLMGDSRNNSADSRVPGHGSVPVENVIGKARLIVLPFTRFGWIPEADPQSRSVGLGADALDVAGLGAVALVAAVPLVRRRRRVDLLDLDDCATWPQRRA